MFQILRGVGFLVSLSDTISWQFITVLQFGKLLAYLYEFVQSHLCIFVRSAPVKGVFNFYLGVGLGT